MLKCNQMLGYPQEYVNTYYMFSEGGTIREFINEIKRIASLITDEDTRNKFKGDMLEVFSEVFFSAFSMDEAVGVNDYTPVPLESDYGVDAFGVNANGHNVAVQVKFRGNPTDLVTFAEVARTYTAGKKLHNLELDEDKTIYVFTNANGVTHPCNEVLGRSLVVISRGEISHKVDNNKLFWKYAYQQILDKIQIT